MYFVRHLIRKCINLIILRLLFVDYELVSNTKKGRPFHSFNNYASCCMSSIPCHSTCGPPYLSNIPSLHWTDTISLVSHPAMELYNFCIFRSKLHISIQSLSFLTLATASTMFVNFNPYHGPLFFYILYLATDL